eukprot:g452.t1
MSSLLQLRGVTKVGSPLIDKEGNVLLYNGELYGGIDVQLDENDGEKLLNKLSMVHSDRDLVDIFVQLLGPWSLIYWKKDGKELWFGRDCLGRRSLLTTHLKDQIILSSVSSIDKNHCPNWSEVSPALYKMCFFENGQDKFCIKTVHEWRKESLSRSLIFNSLKDATQALLMVLQHAIQIRVQSSSTQISDSEEDRVLPILVLFSGGIDSTLIAALLHKCLSPKIPVDLCNVSFQGDQAADRKTAVEAFLELRKWAPDRHWKLINVDSSLEAMEDLQPHIMSLLHPCDTIMDLNIGTPLWLAAKGEGVLYPPSNDSTYRSQARIVFVGHGADEQCVGYSRHRTKYREGGIEALEHELVLEMNRLWKRNLGRDDRLISDHGREARFPFLDESVVRFIARLPMEYLFNFNQPRGVGEKIILRNCLCQLGLATLSKNLKRAIQFGTHIGKLANKKQFGSNRAANKSHAGTLTLTDRQNTDTQK